MSPLPFLAVAVDKHRMPRNCSIRTLGSTPDLNAADTARQVASDWLGQPPALPRLANTSHRPCSSLLTVTKSVPQPMRNLSVLPAVDLARGRGESMAAWARELLPAAERV